MRAKSPMFKWLSVTVTKALALHGMELLEIEQLRYRAGYNKPMSLELKILWVPLDDGEADFPLQRTLH